MEGYTVPVVLDPEFDFVFTVKLICTEFKHRGNSPVFDRVSHVIHPNFFKPYRIGFNDRPFGRLDNGRSGLIDSLR